MTTLLKQVDDLYQAGLKDYNADQMDGAKDKFDQALNLLLGSGLDIRGDDRLNAEFERLVENTYNLEITALERGEAMSSHAYEPAPLQSFAGLTFPVDPNIRERAQHELASVQSDLPLTSNDYVSGALTYLQNHARHYVQRVLAGRSMYGPMIEQTLKKDGLPADLIYLAAGESAFSPYALNSKSGAKGMWQFMVSTGELYGLRKNRWVDEREDPIKSTQAAARHLKDLYHTFGDWYLAMAAYDWGSNGVQKAIEKTGYADYWKLRALGALPSETQNYVPIFVAIALIAKDPQAYGFQAPADPPLAFDSVPVTEPVDLRLVAGLIDRPVDELVRLNPSMLTWVTPPNDPDFKLHLPAGTRDLYEKEIAAIPPSHREWWRSYKVESGETLAAVARKFHVSEASLTEANRLSRSRELDPGAHLVIPLSPSSQASLVRVHEHYVLRAKRYRVRPGDTLELVADRYDVTPYQIRHWNRLRGSRLVAGTSLTLFVHSAAPAQHSRRSRRVAAKRRTHAKSKVLASSAGARGQPTSSSSSR
ncbi:MAG TPA: transglycosylase SLT domain-containing protein [Terriglobia bacterium]|nr:transglycosylase SLT domain-containing protein [Terriglobia bacterium]